MTNRSGLLALALAVAGVVLIGASIADGSTQVYLLVIVPVLTGASALFLGGVLCLALAMGLSVLVVADREEPPAARPPDDQGGAPEGSSTGGVLLIGPLPIFFGSASALRDRYFWVAVAAGATLCIALLALVYLG